MRLNRPENWLALIAVTVGLLLAEILGLHAYVTGAAMPLHRQLA